MRRALTVASVVSALLAAAIAAGWARSYWRDDQLSGTLGRDGWTVDALWGRVRVIYTPGLNNAGPDPEWRWRTMSISGLGAPIFTMDRNCAWHVAGFGLDRTVSGAGGASGRQFTFTNHVVVVPHWFLLGIALVLPACWARAWAGRRRRRRMTGLCPACGYDLRATPDQCPECGRRRSADPA